MRLKQLLLGIIMLSLSSTGLLADTTVPMKLNVSAVLSYSDGTLINSTSTENILIGLYINTTEFVWQKTVGVWFQNGLIEATLVGTGTNSNGDSIVLNESLFENENLKVGFVITEDGVDKLALVELVSQPYAIKSARSDYAHDAGNTSALKGVAISDDVPSENSIMVYSNTTGQWAPNQLSVLEIPSNDVNEISGSFENMTVKRILGKTLTSAVRAGSVMPTGAILMYSPDVDAPNGAFHPSSGNPNPGEVLTWDGENDVWMPSSNRLEKLSDVSVNYDGAPANNIFKYDSNIGKYKLVEIGIDYLNDVSVLNQPKDGELLIYSNGQWRNNKLADLQESLVEEYIANDVDSGYVPYDNGVKLSSSPLYWDSINSRFGIGTTAPEKYLHVAGDVKANAFIGDGSGLTSVTASSVAWSNVTGKSVVNEEIANDTIESRKIKDGTIVDGDISGSAGIAFSKLAIDGANVRSVNPYSGGTGVTVGVDGVVAIGQAVGTTDSPTFEAITAKKVHAHIGIQDTRNDNEAPNDFFNEVAWDFKASATLAGELPNTYAGVMTIAPWSDSSGGNDHQLAFVNNGVYYRSADANALQWGNFSKLVMENASGNVNVDTLTANAFIGDGSGLTSVTASSVNWSNVTNKNVLSSEIANGTIINDDIADNTITNAKILEGTIESGKIKDGTIVNADISETAEIAFSKLSVTAANIRGLSAYSGGTGVTVNGDGVVAIGQAVGTTDSPTFQGMTLNGTLMATGTVSANAFIGDGSQLTNVSASSVNWSKVTSKNVLSSEIADGTIVAADMADAAVSTEKIAGDAVTTEKIADGTIVDGDISGSAEIAFSKLSVTATNIRGLSAYSGGTGVTVNGDGVVAIGQEVATTNSPVFSGMTLAAGTGSTVEGGQIILNDANNNKSWNIDNYGDPSSSTTQLRFFREGSVKMSINQSGTVNVSGDLVTGGTARATSMFLGEANKTPTTNANVKLHVDGDAQVDGAIYIAGGSDLAEGFHIVASEKVEPGTVVSIDPNNIGKLIVTNEANDTKVAGVVSGGNGIKAGLIMTQTGTLADGEYPIALTGRVWVKCTNENGTIGVGDLLTTASKPGHAMKADGSNSQGAILGKAMSPCSKDNMALTLISLQ